MTEKVVAITYTTVGKSFEENRFTIDLRPSWTTQHSRAGRTMPNLISNSRERPLCSPNMTHACWIADFRWDEKAGLQRDALSSQVIGALQAHEIRRPAMRKPGSTALRRRGKQHGEQPTIGLDLGDRSSFYCVLSGAGEVLLEAKVATNPETIRKTFEKMPSSRIALETGTHSPWVIRADGTEAGRAWWHLYRVP